MGQTGSGMKGPGGGRRGMAQMARMLEGLNLTPEQWDQVRSLARERKDVLTREQLKKPEVQGL